MTHELIEYRVTGTIKSGGKFYCDCRWCNGHDNRVIEDVDYAIEAEDEQEAKRLAELQYTESGGHSFGEWVNLLILPPGEKPPRPREVELALLDRWNKGLGLPAEPEEFNKSLFHEATQ